MRKQFQAELHQVDEDLIEISQLVGEAMQKAIASLDSADVELAEDVIASDARIDFLQNALDERAIDILARQAPVAGDLRQLVASLRMSASLERMGDLARHIAQTARLRYPAKVVPESLAPVFHELGELDLKICSSLSTLLDSKDLDEATNIVAFNTRVNELHAGVFKTIASDGWAEPAATAVDVSLLSRYFERFADHGVSVARKVTYLVTGEWHVNGNARLQGNPRT